MGLGWGKKSEYRRIGIPKALFLARCVALERGAERRTRPRIGRAATGRGRAAGECGASSLVPGEPFTREGGTGAVAQPPPASRARRCWAWGRPRREPSRCSRDWPRCVPMPGRCPSMWTTRHAGRPSTTASAAVQRKHRSRRPFCRARKRAEKRPYCQAAYRGAGAPSTVTFGITRRPQQLGCALICDRFRTF